MLFLWPWGRKLALKSVRNSTLFCPRRRLASNVYFLSRADKTQPYGLPIFAPRLPNFASNIKKYIKHKIFAKKCRNYTKIFVKNEKNIYNKNRVVAFTGGVNLATSAIKHSDKMCHREANEE